MEKITIGFVTRSSEVLRRATSLILDPRRPARSLGQEVAEMTAILAHSRAIRSARRAGASGEGTWTHDGLALPPTLAATCAGDVARTVEFIRGTHAAIRDVRRAHPDRATRVLYAGCGPFATLAVPLMAILPAGEAIFTLLDIHPESIESARSVLAGLGLADFVAGCETLDAASYRVDPAQMPDIILMEMMQACLEAEPHVAIARHLAAQAPDAILIPEEVRIDLVLADVIREFDAHASERNDGETQRDRIPVATVFTVDRAAIESWKGSSGDRLAGSVVRLPGSTERRYQPLLFTTVRVYQDNVLNDYDSGLTCPRIFASEEPLKPGDTIRFSYELGPRPRLRGHVEAGPLR